MRGGPILVVPAFEKRRGGGHLVRSLVLVRSLRLLGREAYLHIPGLENGALPGDVLGLADTGKEPLPILDAETLNAKSWAFIVLDRFRTSREELIRWSQTAPVIGIDEGGPCRGGFDFLMDLLPGPPGVSLPNILSPRLLPLPKNRRTSFHAPRNGGPGAGRKILVSFGAEDPARLTVPVSLALALPGNTRGDTTLSEMEVPQDIFAVTAILGMLNHGKDTNATGSREKLMAAGVRVMEGVEELREHIAEYALVITHFGLTAFESLYAKVPVLLVSPGAYHEKLAKNAGFISAGIGNQGACRIPRLIYQKPSGRAAGYTLNEAFFASLGDRCEKIAERYGLAGNEASPQSLGVFLETLSLMVSPSCPVCGEEQRVNHPVLARFPTRTYRRCSRCGMVYMLRSSPPPIAYERDYFFDFYKKQYGKTYLEDFPNLIQTGNSRLQCIKALLSQSETTEDAGTSGRRLLDIGCAYGPFLVAAEKAGFSPTGIEAAEDAVRYVQEELVIPCFRGLFPDTPLPADPGGEGFDFDVVSLWYVIEHFEDPQRVLREIGKRLKPGGVLAFSTPSFSGISGRVAPVRFLDKSPPDHWTIWEPRRVNSILKLCGFTVKKIVVTGHHPERFPLVGKSLAGKRGPIYQFFWWISRVFRLGDTFEIYAVKS